MLSTRSITTVIVVVVVVAIASTVITTVHAHGAMCIPPTRNAGSLPGLPLDMNLGGCEGAACMWFNQGCTIGCEQCDDTFNNFQNFGSACGIKYPKSTLPDEFRTYNLNDTDPYNPTINADWTVHHPWRAPGRAPVLDSCGVSGGSTHNNDPAGGIGNVTIARKQGVFGSKFLPPVTWSTTKWVIGSTAEVEWGIAANHGGGYQYRLCPADQELNEACFQKTPLKFSGSKQKLRWDNGYEVEIDAHRVSDGTIPVGSEWTKNPIPSCGNLGLSAIYTKHECGPPQFPPPIGCNETCWGYQPHTKKKLPPLSKTLEIPAIVDLIEIPSDLKPGKYVVGWRWDCEQTPQVWTNCGDVELVSSN